MIARSHNEWPINEGWSGLGIAAAGAALAINPLPWRRVEIRPTVRVTRTTPAAGLTLMGGGRRPEPDDRRRHVAEGVDVDAARADGATALLWASHWDDVGLLAAGADVNLADDHGVTALERAAENASLAMVETLDRRRDEGES